MWFDLDLFPPADVLGNLETGLPFKNVSFDTVVALDVLEHTDNIHRAFSELCRIARKYILIILPNLYDLKLRICVLMGRRFDQYSLPVDPPKDRHRWFFSLQEARSFTHTLGQRHLFQVQEEGCLISGPPW
jgi:SAM-dependent methyltransferase